MTYLPNQTRKAMTAIAAVLAFTSTPLAAQDTTPVDPVETTAETPAADPLAPQADTTPVVTDTAAPPAPKPKVETTRAKSVTTKTTRASAATRPAARRTNTAAEAPAPVAAAATTAPAAQPAPPPVAVEAAPAPAAEPVAASEPTDNAMTELMENGALPIAAGALGLLALGAGVVAMRRRTRRREEEDYLARQQALDAIGDEPAELELDQRADVAPAPAFVRPAPMHDPIPERKVAAMSNPDDQDFLFRRVHKAPAEPVEPN